MYVSQVSLHDFRNYTSATLAWPPGLVLLVGRNGQGKTNIAEAIGYAATLSSHRVATDAPLIRAGQDQAVVRVGVVREEREQLVELELAAGRANRARLNKAARRPRDLLGTLRVVLFSPEDLALVKGDPGERRRFLDALLVSRQPRWAGVMADYATIVKQRTAALKAVQKQRRSHGGRSRSHVSRISTGSSTGVFPTLSTGAEGVPPSPTGGVDATVDTWSDHAAEVGAQLLYARLRLTRDLGPHLAHAYEAVSDSSSRASLRYRSSLPEDTHSLLHGDEVPEPPVLQRLLREAMYTRHDEECDRGQSLVGPHRDELELTLGGLPAKGYASHGETWSMALGLRLASRELLRHDLGEEPVLILDDVFAELDVRRRDRLADLIADCEQVIITAAVEADVPERLKGHIFDVADGAVTPRDAPGVAHGGEAVVPSPVAVKPPAAHAVSVFETATHSTGETDQ